MKKTRFLSFVLPIMLFAATMFTSCSSSEKEENAEAKSKEVAIAQSDRSISVVPKNALAVANINLGAIWEKGEFDNLKNLSEVKKARREIKQNDPEIDKLIESILNNPSSCGLNMKDNIVAFVAKEGRNTFFVASVPMDNKETFDGFLNKLAEINGNNVISEGEKISENGITYLIYDRAIAAYDKNKLLFVTTNNYEMNVNYMKKYTSKILKLESSNCIAQVDSFRKYWNKRGDISVWGSFKNILSYSLKIKERIDIVPKDVMKDVENMAAYLSFTFEDGSLALQLNSIGTPENVSSILSNNFNKNIIKYMPGNTLAAATLSLDMNNIVNLINNVAGKNTPMNQSIGIRNYKIKDVVNAFGGSFVASFYGMINDEIPAVAVAADIKNYELVKNMIEQFGFYQDGDFYRSYDAPFTIYLKKDAIIVSTDGSVLNKAVNGGYSNGLGNIADKAKDGNYVYVNLDYDRYPSEIKKIIDDDVFTHHYYAYKINSDDVSTYHYYDDEAARAFTEIMRWFRNADVKLGNNGLVVKVYTSDSNTNSLSFLINKINQLATKYNK